jgi:hypothetical protein
MCFFLSLFFVTDLISNICTDIGLGHESLKKAGRRAIVPVLKLQFNEKEINEKDSFENAIPSDRFGEDENDQNRQHRFRLTEIENQINPSDVKMHLVLAKEKQMMEKVRIHTF